MTIHLGRLLPDASRDLPGWRPKNMPAALSGAIPIWSCSRRGLPCRACCQPRGALLPHPFTLTLITEGGLLSVALSLGLPPPGITRHRVFVEPGLSSPALLKAKQERPSSHLARHYINMTATKVKPAAATRSQPTRHLQRHQPLKGENAVEMQ